MMFLSHSERPLVSVSELLEIISRYISPGQRLSLFLNYLFFQDADRKRLALFVPEVLTKFWKNRSDTEKNIVNFTLRAFVPEDQIKIIKPIIQFIEDFL